MLKLINRIPAGTFLVPMLLSMIVTTLWPGLFNIGGLTEGLLSGSGTAFISGILAFAVGTRIELSTIGSLLKHQGSLLLLKIIIATVLSVAYLYVFGNDGVLGIPAISLMAVLFSVNPAVQVSILENYGYKEDAVVMGLSTAVTLPMLPLIVYSVYASGGLAGVDWVAIFSVLFPMLLGLLFGNIDPDIRKLYGPTVGIMLPFLGWNLGQAMNIAEALQAGVSGLLLTILYVVIMSSLYLADRYLLKFEGISGLAMMSVAGVSTIVPAVLAESFPELAQYTTTANSQILLAAVITSILTPIITGRLYRSQKE